MPEKVRWLRNCTPSLPRVAGRSMGARFDSRSGPEWARSTASCALWDRLTRIWTACDLPPAAPGGRVRAVRAALVKCAACARARTGPNASLARAQCPPGSGPSCAVNPRMTRAGLRRRHRAKEPARRQVPRRARPRRRRDGRRRRGAPLQLDQRVAIKFVPERRSRNEERSQRFLREAQAAVKLKSEHVARVLDVGTLENGAPYMVMEYLEGRDLGERPRASAARCPSRRPPTTMLQACEAVAEAHALGIVHRDIKPENLFLARAVGGAPAIKVLDFGISKSLGATRRAGRPHAARASLLGSPLYMSPEQMRSSRDVDARTDIWALGVVLYELLTGRCRSRPSRCPSCA